MKANTFRVTLECVKGSVPPDSDSVEVTGPTLRTSDGHWWSEATLQDATLDHMVLPYSPLRSIVKTLDDDEDLQIIPNGATCRVKASTALWQLNLLNVPTEPLPDFSPLNTIEASGYTLLEAHRRLKHLIHPCLSRPGLMWAGTDYDHHLVIGDGSRLGGYHTDINGLELPTLTLSEIWRILGIRMSEKVTFTIGEKNILVALRDTRFHTTLPQGPRFDIGYCNDVRSSVIEDPQVIKTSCSDLLRAINQVKVTAGESIVKISSSNGNLILASTDSNGNKSASKIEAHGNLREVMTLNIDHLGSATEVLSDELMVLKVCKSAVEVSDGEGWEIIVRR